MIIDDRGGVRLGPVAAPVMLGGAEGDKHNNVRDAKVLPNYTTYCFFTKSECKTVSHWLMI